MKKLNNFLKVRAVNALLLLMMPVLMSCKKQPFPEEPHDNTTTETPSVDSTWTGGHNANGTEPGLSYDGKIEFSWEYFLIGPHYDHILSYTDDPMCSSVRVMSDTTGQSGKCSSRLSPEWWNMVADWWEFYQQQTDGKVMYDGIIRAAEISNSVKWCGMRQETAARFANMGVTIADTLGNVVPGVKNAKKAMPWNTAQKMVANDRYNDKTITWGFNYFPGALCEDHIMRAINNPDNVSVTLTPDSSDYSVMAALQLSAEDWDRIAQIFLKCNNNDMNHKLKFRGTINYFPNRMSPETKHIFETLGYQVVETTDAKGYGIGNSPYNMKNRSR